MSNKESNILHIIGAGLAGSEAAAQAAKAGINVILHEMRPKVMTPAHKTESFAELVCSNSFRSDDSENNAVGLLHEELRKANSIIMQTADKCKVPAGTALAVDRENFSKLITEQLKAMPNVTIVNEEITQIPEDWKNVIIATGPLTSPALAEQIQNVAGANSLAFFDAIAPIIYYNSLDMDICWFQSRYDKKGTNGTGKDYINCPLDKNDYNNFIDALLESETVDFHQWEETPYFDGCLPIEEMAKRGRETLRHGPMKPRGLTNAHQPDIKPYAVLQLRQDNALGTLYNMVGFQTKLKYKEQTKIFRQIPGLEKAEFARLGGLHRNSYLNSPLLLNQTLQLKNNINWRFAGQITGCEGYVESTTIGWLAAYFAIANIYNKKITLPPITSAFGALLNHITKGHLIDNSEGKRSFQPMNINFGLFPEIELLTGTEKKLKGKEKNIQKRQLITTRAKEDFTKWLNDIKL
ncbi:methylenetetrahydrofolate--tRNA-(uracil(54)-C(5))-methyltransferase (FADH(2)-oxidizing) TrmFO [Bartonella sp. DGB1]|uniref:methylenetetrahydrofolate--tRNA-(uracil(54)- C(5))-methyltransferase (FADH(2)-oxidizing) TrmFO n=1 Tax=Bartonella sp. DGB1 TaxID=3239807 RepID=UPI003524D04B